LALKMIRPAIPEDAPFAIPLIIQAIGVIAMSLTGTNNLAEASAILECWFGRKKNRHSFENTLVADEAGVLAGLVVAYDGGRARELDEPLERAAASLLGTTEYRISIESEPGEFYLDAVSVHPNFQGRGLGRQLIDAVCALAQQQGRDRIGLLVETKNLRAQRLYERLGFVEAGKRTILGHAYIHRVREL
jgi:ribosomal protein S18 acetylase RimI-like enzyme